MGIISADIRENNNFDDHEAFVEISRPEVGLRGFIAIHSTDLGPAVGGTRMYPYKTRNEAISDVLRLSRAMTYKCALAGVQFGGGKSVIIGNPKQDKSFELLQAYAEEINKLNGLFFTGEDVGFFQRDVDYLCQYSKFFIGHSGKAGDPSPYAARSTHVAMKAANEVLFGNESLENKKVLIKGVGKVGAALADLLALDKAKIIISDIDRDAIQRVKDRYHELDVIKVSECHKLNCEIFSPCALGDEFTLENISSIKASIICGAANNQLHNLQISSELHKKSIVYIPDFVANSGGLINVVDEMYPGGYNPQRVEKNINNIRGLVKKILLSSKSEDIPPAVIAEMMALDVIHQKSSPEKVIAR